MKNLKKKVLTGNSFPLSLIRREVHIQPISLTEYRQVLQETDWISYWGHRNTLTAAASYCGHDLTPAEERPALTLDDSGYPVLGGKCYTECYILSPEYAPGYRPELNKEVTLDKICGWQVLHMVWV